MQSLIGQDNGMEQLALVFKFTKLAMKIAQHYGSRATDIKENSLRYIGDRFAAWLDSQGGWVRPDNYQQILIYLVLAFTLFRIQYFIQHSGKTNISASTA